MSKQEFEVCNHCYRRLPEEFGETDWLGINCPYCGKDNNDEKDNNNT